MATKTKKTKKAEAEENTQANEATVPEEANEAAVPEEVAQASGSTDLMMALVVHGQTVGLSPEDGEAEDDFQARVIKTIAEVPDETWKTLPEDTQRWFNDIVRSMREEKVESRKKSTKTAKSKDLLDAKAKAKKIVSEKINTCYGRGTNGREIMVICSDAGEKGLTLEEVIELAKAKPISSGNIENRVRQVIKGGLKTHGVDGGWLREEEDGRLIYIGRDLSKDPEPKGPKPFAKKDKPADQEAAAKTKTPKAEAKTPKADAEAEE